MVLKKKLVRDKIHEIYQHRPMHVADDEEYEIELKKKLQEEVDKYIISGKSEELVDILELVYALSDFKGVSVKELEKMRSDKAQKRGKFKKRIIFDEHEPGKAVGFEEEQ